MTSDDNYTVFRECLSSAIVARSEGKPRTTKRRQKPKRSGPKEGTGTETLPERANPEELAEFIDVHTRSKYHDPVCFSLEEDDSKTSHIRIH